MKFSLKCVSLLIGLFLTATAWGETPVIKVGHVGHDHQLALYVAAEAGQSLEKDYGVYFKEIKNQEVYDLYDRGNLVARVFFVRVGGGAKMPAALEQGHIEVGLGGLGPVVKFIDKGTPIKVIAPLNNDGDALIVSKNFPASSWKEFVSEVKRSKQPIKVGYKDPMANAYMILTRGLKEEGISFGLEPVGPDGKPVQVMMYNLQELDNALPSLEAGIVDAVVVNEPMGSLLVHKGVGKWAADLSDLPPKDKWKGHPCCVVAATETALKEKRSAVKALIKAIIAGGDLMALNPERAIDAQSKWTKTSPEVGRKSIRNVSYVIKPDAKWLSAVDTWFDLMSSSGHLKEKLKAKSAADIRSTVMELSIIEEALAEINLKSVGKGKN